MRLVHSNRASRIESNTLGTDWLIGLIESRNAEEDKSSVGPPHLARLVRVGMHPALDAVHRHFFARNEITLDQNTADSGVAVAVMAIVVEPKQRSIFKPYTCRTLDLDRHGVE